MDLLDLLFLRLRKWDQKKLLIWRVCEAFLCPMWDTFGATGNEEMSRRAHLWGARQNHCISEEVESMEGTTLSHPAFKVLFRSVSSLQIHPCLADWSPAGITVVILHSHSHDVLHFHGAVFAQSRTCRLLRALSQVSRATVNHTFLNYRKFDPSLLGPYQQLAFTSGHCRVFHLRKILAWRTDEESLLNVGHPLCGRHQPVCDAGRAGSQEEQSFRK